MPLGNPGKGGDRSWKLQGQVVLSEIAISWNTKRWRDFGVQRDGGGLLNPPCFLRAQVKFSGLKG